MASRRVIYTLLEPVTRPYFAPYRHTYNQRQQEKRQQALQRKWITSTANNGSGNTQEWNDEDIQIVSGSNASTGTVNTTLSKDSQSEDSSESSTAARMDHHRSNENSQDIPWYLRNNDTIKATESLQIREPLPAFPPYCPQSVENFAKYMIDDLGLGDLQVIDLRNLQPESPFGPHAIMLLCSGKSSRHLNRAGQSLISYIKGNYNRTADTEGILSSNFLRVYNRRLRKKAQRQGTANRSFLGGSDGTMVDRTGSWVVLDTKVDGVYVHLFTEERRGEVDLEGFWNEKKRQGGISSVSELVDLPKSKFDKRFILPGSRRNFTTSLKSSFINANAGATGNITSDSNSNSSAIIDEQPLSENQNYLDELQQWSLLGDYKRCIRLTSFAPDNITHEESQKAHTFLLKAHINNITIKQKEKKNSTLMTPKSDVITSFINSFPTDPTPLQWRLRLIFLQKLHSINEQLFPLSLLVEHIVLQQASGIPIESWDVEMAVATIAYSNQFSNKPVNSRTISEWEAVCDEKLRLVMQIHEIAFRSTGEILSASDSLLSLLYRLCFSLGKGSVGKEGKAILPDHALKDPTPIKGKPKSTGEVTGKRAFVDSRASSVLGLFGGEGGVTMTKPLVILILTVLINGGSWDKFWSLWSNISRYTIVDQDLLAVMVSLVAKTGNESNIIYMLERYLPPMLTDLSQKDIKLLPETIQALRASLSYLDPAEARYEVLRNFLDTA